MAKRLAEQRLFLPMAPGCDRSPRMFRFISLSKAITSALSSFHKKWNFVLNWENVFLEPFGAESKMEERASKIWETSASTYEAFRYVTYLYLKSLNSASTRTAQYTKVKFLEK